MGTSIYLIGGLTNADAPRGTNASKNGVVIPNVVRCAGGAWAWVLHCGAACMAACMAHALVVER